MPGPLLIAGVVLAAGSATRMGSTKQLATIEGRPMLQHVIDRAAASGLDEVVVVVGHAAEAIESAIDLPPVARLVRNADHASGQASSFAAGLRALGPEIHAAVVLLADQPDVRPTAIRKVCRLYTETGGPVVRARYGGEPGHPVAIDRRLWEVLAEARGDRGAGPSLSTHPDWVVWADIDGPAPQEVDTAGDLARVRERGLTPA